MKKFVGPVVILMVLLAGCGAEDRSSSETAKPDLERYRRNPSLRTTAPAEVFAPIATNNPEKIIAMGERYYQRVCATCHDHGLAGAPILGDADAWEIRLAKGTPKLVQNAVDGLGEMPPRGGDPSLRKEAVRLAVEYMMEQVR